MELKAKKITGQHQIRSNQASQQFGEQGWLELRLELKQNFSQDQRGLDEEIQDYIENIAKNEYFERSSLFHTHI